MQSQKSSANNHDRYNRPTCADHAVTRITPVLSASMHIDQNKYKWAFSFNEKGESFLVLFPKEKKPSSKILAFESCNPCNLQIIVDSSPPKCGFFPI